jgi:tRNA A-37 threonylcarbamoyl transferase component Bud32
MAGTGRVIAGRYRLQDPIGRGAMGTVWRAWDEILDREVAVKELRIRDSLTADERSRAHQRTHREARTAARLSHPGVVTVFDVAEEDGRPWIIMELVEARSLDQIISRDGPLPPQRAAEAGRQLLAALAAAHAAGVLHRDVKPSNVLLAEGGRAVLTDFGIATFEGDPGLTQTGMVMGSPGFTAPERIRGNPATPASDLWSLGATLYAAVEGHGPFERLGGAITTMSAIINEDPPSAPSAAALAPVIDALLRRNPADRPDAATAARMLGAALPPAPPGSYVPVGVAMASADLASPGAVNAGMAVAAQDGPAIAPAPGRPQAGQQALIATPTSVDLPAHLGRPVQLSGARQGPAELAPDHLPPPRNGEAASGPPTPAEFFSGPGTPGELPSGTRPFAQRKAGTTAGWPARLPANRRVLVLAGIFVLVIAVAAAVVALRVYHRAQAAGTPGQDSAAGSPVAAAAAPPSTGPLPRGFRWHTVPATAAGTIAGFTVAVPDGWTVSSRGAATYFSTPDRSQYFEVDLTPHTYTNMLREARYLAALTQQQDKFPGYRGHGIRAVNVRGMKAAAWEFTWQDPVLGRVRALDLMYIKQTPGGPQSYALYLSAPDRAWSRSLGVFDEEMRTFRPES